MCYFINVSFSPQTAESTTLLSGSGSLPSPSLKRQARSAPAPLSGHLINYSQHQEDADTPDSLNQLLARLISRKGVIRLPIQNKRTKGRENKMTAFPFSLYLSSHYMLIFPSSSHPSFCSLRSFMLCFSPTIWHFPPPSGLLSSSFHACYSPNISACALYHSRLPTS